MIKYRGNHSYLYNIVSGTTPVVIHGNGPIKVSTMVTIATCMTLLVAL